MTEAFEDNEALIRAIEEKAGYPQYRAGRKSIYEELERILPEKDYTEVLSALSRGYVIYDHDPHTDEIAKELWAFSEHLHRLVEEKERELSEHYPEWFTGSLRLQVTLVHPLNRPPSNQKHARAQETIIGQLAHYLRPYFLTKTGMAELLAQIFLYFYGKDYPEVDPKKIAPLL